MMRGVLSVIPYEILDPGFVDIRSFVCKVFVTAKPKYSKQYLKELPQSAYCNALSAASC